jgi:hypothetical protein
VPQPRSSIPSREYQVLAVRADAPVARFVEVLPLVAPFGIALPPPVYR